MFFPSALGVSRECARPSRDLKIYYNVHAPSGMRICRSKSLLPQYRKFLKLSLVHGETEVCYWSRIFQGFTVTGLNGGLSSEITRQHFTRYPTLKAVDTAVECAQVETLPVFQQRPHIWTLLWQGFDGCYDRASMPNQVTLPSFNYLENGQTNFSLVPANATKYLKVNT